MCTQEAGGLKERIVKNLEVIVAAAFGILLGAYLVQRAGLMQPMPAAVPCVCDVDKPQKQGNKASPRARVSP